MCKDANLQGSITIGENTVVHPGAEILALGGPIEIGANNIIGRVPVVLLFKVTRSLTDAAAVVIRGAMSNIHKS